MQHRILFLLLLLTFSWSAVQNKIENDGIEEAVALGEYLHKPDQAYNYADPKLPALFNSNTNTNVIFKNESLRNIELTSPYLHVGKFESLEDVVEQNNSVIKNSPNLDNRLRENGLPRRMNLTQQEMNSIVAFIETLIDQSFITDPKFTTPFIV